MWVKAGVTVRIVAQAVGLAWAGHCGPEHGHVVRAGVFRHKDWTLCCDPLLCRLWTGLDWTGLDWAGLELGGGGTLATLEGDPA
jgi:hypothetical protein